MLLLLHYFHHYNFIAFICRFNDCTLVLTQLFNFVSSLYKVVEPRIQQRLVDVIYIINDIDFQDFTQLMPAHATIKLICDCLSESDLFTRDMHVVWKLITENTLKLMITLRYNHNEMSSTLRAELKELVSLTWIYVGWIQTCLLMPVFDADPSVKTQSELACWQMEVRRFKL